MHNYLRWTLSGPSLAWWLKVFLSIRGGAPTFLYPENKVFLFYVTAITEAKHKRSTLLKWSPALISANPKYLDGCVKKKKKKDLSPFWVDSKSAGRPTLHIFLPSSSKHARVWGYIISLRSYEGWGTVCMCANRNISQHLCQTWIPSVWVRKDAFSSACLTHTFFRKEHSPTFTHTHTHIRTHPHCEFLNLAFGSSTAGLFSSLTGVSPVQKGLCRFHDTHVEQRSARKNLQTVCKGYFFHCPKSQGTSCTAGTW